ncbi:MAG: TetR/AcrR family transcriptional regulator [Stagnimonas sp.]|nr:TetR/AcrR family transcriptional regulator [Stagnimonas sp.]
MLSAAQAVFLEHGYTGASLEEVIQRVGGSKASLYSYFGSKEGLFEQMVVAGCERFLRDVAIPTAIDGDLESTLRAFGLRFFKLFTDPSKVRLMRAIISEATRFPSLAQQFYENGPRRARIQLAAFFARCHAEGHMQVPDPDFAAIQFITLMKGHCQFRSLLGLSPLALPLSPEAFVAESVRLFLGGCLLPANPKKPARSRT